MNNKKDRVLESWPPPPRRSPLSILSPRGDNVFSFFPRNMLPSVFSATKRDSPPLRVTAETSMPFPSLPPPPPPLFLADLPLPLPLPPPISSTLSSNSEQRSPSNYRLVNSFSSDRVGSLNRFSRDQSCRLYIPSFRNDFWKVRNEPRQRERSSLLRASVLTSSD